MGPIDFRAIVWISIAIGIVIGLGLVGLFKIAIWLWEHVQWIS